MPEKKPRPDAAPAMSIKKMTLLDGSRVGIMNLENILKEVAELKLTDAQAIRAELLKRVKVYNYVPPGAENEYSAALYQEYQRKTGAIKNTGETEAHRHTSR